MKTIIKNDKIIVFLRNDFNLKEESLEDYFKSMLLTLNKKYDLELNGYYNVDVYKDTYGMAIELSMEDLDYYNYFNQVDMNINILPSKGFLYEIAYEFLNDVKTKYISYIYHNKIYIKMIDKLSDIALAHLFELTNVIYGSKAEEILKYGKKVDLWQSQL